METRFYYFHGQNPSNTNISDRAHALHITKNEWNNITEHLNRKKKIQEALEQEERKKKYLDEGSKSMIKNWENSLENITRRKQEEKSNNLIRTQQERMERFNKLREEQEEIHKEFVSKAFRENFIHNGHARCITSSFLNSEVQFERQKQIELKQMVKKHEEEEESKNAAQIFDNVRKHNEKMAANAQKLFEKNKDYYDGLKNIADKKKLNEKLLREKKFIKEAEDNSKASQELELIEKTEQENILREKREMYQNKLANDQFREFVRKEKENDEKEIDEVVAISCEKKFKIDCMKKQNEREEQDSKLIRMEAITKKVWPGTSELIIQTEKNVQAAIEKKEAEAEAKLKAKAEHERMVKEENALDRKKFLKKEESLKRKEKELKKWELINRFKTYENMNENENDKKLKQWKKVIDYRNELLEQMKEKNEIQMRENEIKAIPDKSALIADAQFFDYADEVLQNAKKMGRSTIPIEKAIMEYKKINNIYSVPQSGHCENYQDPCRQEKNKKSIARELIKNSVKTRPCKCKAKISK